MQSGPLSSRRGGPDTHDRTKRPSGRCRHADEVLKNTSDSRAPTTPPKGGGGRIINFTAVPPSLAVRARFRGSELVCVPVWDEDFLTRAESPLARVDHGASEVCGLVTYAGVCFPSYPSSAGGVEKVRLTVWFEHVSPPSPWGIRLGWVSLCEGVAG